MPEATETRQSKYLKNMVEQDHRFFKRRSKPVLGFGSFNTAKRTLTGYEAIYIIGLTQSDATVLMFSVRSAV
ncbi:MAG: DDE-type integrase/transposase/recombinase [Cyanobacteria bacterium J06614_10]